jgi:predicted phosphodiesterase
VNGRRFLGGFSGLACALVLFGGGCDPPPDSDIEFAGFASRQNHPNSLVATRLAQQPLVYPLRFALLSDTHLPTGDAVFARLREQLLQLSPPPSFAVVIGDFVEEGTIPQHVAYLGIIDHFPIPVFSVIGNHEQWTPQARWNYARYHGPEDFAFDFAASRFIALNDCVPRRDGLTDLQIGWLERQLAGAPPNRFVLMHAPPPVLPAPWGSPPFFNVERFYELVERFGVKLVVTGHVHEFKHRLVNGVHYLQTGASGGLLDPKLTGLQDPPAQAILHSFLLVTMLAEGQGIVELIPVSDHPEPAPSYTVHFGVATSLP